MPTRTPICPESGFTKRAKRFFDEQAASGIFVGIAVGDPWTDENAPPDPVIGDRGLGRISLADSDGDSLTAENCELLFNRDCFQAGIESYRVEGLANNRYRVVKVSDDTVIATALEASDDLRKDLVPGLSFRVTAEAITEGDFREFKVDGPIAFKKCEQVKLVVPDEDGEIEYYNGNFREVDPADAYDEKVRHVYVLAVFRYDEHPLVDFRQVGVLTGLVRAEGVSGAKNNLLPSEVEVAGDLELLVNDTQTIREIQDRQHFAMILEFGWLGFLVPLAMAILGLGLGVSC